MKPSKFFLLIFLPFSIIVLFLFYDAINPQKKLPIFQPAMVNYELVDSTMQHVKRYHRISSFSLKNQNAETITEKNYDNKIYVADFFFTTCPGICIDMTRNMLKIQKKIIDNPNIMLLSFSVTPKIDSVAQLKKYALEKGINDSKWNLLTGDKKQIYRLARESYFVVKEGQGINSMIHTENFVLIDPDKRIRGFYDGTDDEEIIELMEDIIILEKEYFH
ncbi:MAG: SCO family protein [Flavobacteriaceae bacterium]|nr:SCO family protein [Flavobacteriaceae bacterium]|tara:strand:- start:1528 stop:2184 length:657 start_codon:yes stop_codon:yes gene_type:complete